MGLDPTARWNMDRTTSACPRGLAAAPQTIMSTFKLHWPERNSRGSDNAIRTQKEREAHRFGAARRLAEMVKEGKIRYVGVS